MREKDFRPPGCSDVRPGFPLSCPSTHRKMVKSGLTYVCTWLSPSTRRNVNKGWLQHIPALGFPCVMFPYFYCKAKTSLYLSQNEGGSDICAYLAFLAFHPRSCHVFLLITK